MAVTIDLTDIRVPPLPSKPRFLNIPRELRDMIYDYALIEPNYFSRRHDAYCKFRVPGSVDPEKPPFVDTDPNKDCFCTRRQGLGLLLANRQVHDEAAPIFWGRNVHCFRNCYQLAHNIKQLRKRCREYLRHVQITEPNYPFDHGYTYTAGEVWDHIFLCKNLRILEIEPNLKFCQWIYSKICANLPHLESLVLTRICGYSCLPYDIDPYRRTKIWVKVTQNIPLDLCSGPRDAIRDFETSRLVHVSFEVNNKFLGQPKNHSWYTAEDPVLASHLKDNNNVQTVTLRDSTVLDLPIYGLPNSRATCASRYRQRRFEQNRRKAAGLPSRDDARVALLTSEARKKKKIELEYQERLIREREQRERKVEAEEYREERATAESKNRANRAAKKRRKIRKAEKTKQEERKRVPKKS